MDLKIIGKDPFKILYSTKQIVENLNFIEINSNKFEEICNDILSQLKVGLDPVEKHFGHANTLEKIVQLIFLEDTVNFCFWEEKGKEKWKIEWPKGHLTSGGWYSLGACFQRAMSNKIPVLDAEYMSEITEKQTEDLFEGVNNIKIPLLKERQRALQESGRVLAEKYDGQFINLLETANFDAINIIELILKDFSFFRDLLNIQGRNIYFLKRAQICVQDLSYNKSMHKKMKIKNIDILTAFADYKIPQMLRKYGLITYKKSLAEKVDNYILIPKDSREEIEIRSVTIWCIELIRQKLNEYTAGDIDNALWLISQDNKGINPYHRTYTIYY